VSKEPIDTSTLGPIKVDHDVMRLPLIQRYMMVVWEAEGALFTHDVSRRTDLFTSQEWWEIERMADMVRAENPA
jgi:hypothetical protein